METLFQEFLSLSAFSGDNATAFLRLRQFFSEKFGPLGAALLLVKDIEPGGMKLVAFADDQGREEVPLTDAFLQSATLYHDALTKTLLKAGACTRQLTAADKSTRFGRHLGEAQAVAISPLAVNGTACHWMLLFSSDADSFEKVDPSRLMLEVNLATQMLRSAINSRELQQVAQKTQLEIDSLANVQRLLLPPEESDISGIEISVHYQPAEIAAGDYYDIMPLTHYYENNSGKADVWGVMVADVSGHGPAAAMEAAMFDAILRTFQGENVEEGPSDVLNYANRFFFTRRVRPHFLTAWGATYDPDERCLMFTSAGHPAPLLKRGKDIRPIGEKSGIPLGVTRDATWITEEVEMLPGDALIIFTDGIVEAMDSAGDQFGTERLIKAASEGGDKAKAIRDKVLSALFRHQEAAVGFDDQTLLVVRQLD